MDISWLSDYPEEYLLFDHEVNIESWISSDYDQYYIIIIIINKKIINGPLGHRSYEIKGKIPKYLIN